MRFVADLRSDRRRFYSGGSRGLEVHAATSLRRRTIAFDLALLDHPAELRRIVTHELFHFAWIRLSNVMRRDWERLIESERKSSARGELGWPAELRKNQLRAGDLRHRTRLWREYACESFCDTAAWALSGVRRHPEFTLASRFRAHRARWLVALLRGCGARI